MDINIIQSGAAPGLGVDDLVPGPSGKLDAGVVAQFSNLMDPSATTTGAIGNTQAGITRPDGSALTIGERVLGGLQSLSSDLQNTWHTIGKSVSSDMKMSEMAALQMHIGQATFQFDCVTKASSLLQKNTDQLLKQQ